jgi:hypothetical protein
MRRFTLGLAVAAVLIGSVPGTVVAEDLCGYFAMAGAYQSERSARREAKRLDIDYYDLDESDSDNAGEGYFVVASGPYDRESQARREARRLNREPDVDGAYAKQICFFLE